MKLDFEIVQNPRFYHHAADAMSRLTQTGISSPRGDKDVDKNLSTYCIMKPESAVCAISDDNYSAVLTIPTTKDLLASPQTDSYCQRILKLVQDRGSSFTINDD